MTNSLLADHLLPAFDQFNAAEVAPALDQLIADCLALAESSSKLSEPTWQNFVAPLEAINDKLNKAWSPVGHLNGVKNNEALRTAYAEGIAKLTEYSTQLGQHQGLYQAYQAVANSEAFEQLTTAQKTAIEHALRDFKLAGVALEDDQKQRYSELKQRLSELNTQFSNNVLDATQAWFKHFETTEGLEGLPESALSLAKQLAAGKELEGYVITLDIPSYMAVMTYADSAALRKEVYSAYASRANEDSEWNNTPLIEEILALRHELAQLLGFENYAELSVATKMANSADQVEQFLVDLAEKSRATAQQDLQQLEAFAQQQGLDQLNAWDTAYYAEKLKNERYSVSQEALRPYFPAPNVVAGLFEITGKLFNFEVAKAPAPSYHADVNYYQISRNGEAIAGFYLDLYARENKRGGAWMDECRVRREREGKIQLPVAYLTCNFTPPVDGKPALLTHDEVTTLFHEFGHGLHHMLTQVSVAAVSGINGVAWDAVELPSQFLENWCWQPEGLAIISGHFETGEALPQEMLNNLLAAKNFQSGMQMLRQIEFALFDLRLHKNYQPDSPTPVQEVLDEVRAEVAVLIPPSFNRFQNSFSHIFAGGYAAGYYSYKWAEVLSADAFAAFEEEGIMNVETGTRFLNAILEKGGSEDAMTLFTQFRGREPSNDALLRHSGINS